MQGLMIKVGKRVVNIGMITECHWEGSEVFIHYHDGRFDRLKGAEADAMWNALMGMCLDVDTGEIGTMLEALGNAINKKSRDRVNA